MDSHAASELDPHMPTVTGFEMPPSSAVGGGRAPQVMLALLDVPPSPDWLRSFVDSLDEFKGEHELADVRITGANISVIGPFGVLRTLTGDLKAFVHRISRHCLQQRVTTRPGKTDPQEVVHVIEADDPAQVEREAAGTQAHTRLIAQTGALLVHAGVAEAAGRLGISERHLRRISREAIGIGPNTFARLARFQRALDIDREYRPTDWADVAARASYYDQAHLIAEYRAITGTTPRAFLAELRDVDGT